MYSVDSEEKLTPAEKGVVHGSLMRAHKSFITKMYAKFGIQNLPDPINISFSNWSSLFGMNELEIGVSSGLKESRKDDFSWSNYLSILGYDCFHETAHYLHHLVNLDSFKNLGELGGFEASIKPSRRYIEFVADFATILYMSEKGDFQSFRNHSRLSYESFQPAYEAFKDNLSLGELFEPYEKLENLKLEDLAKMGRDDASPILNKYWWPINEEEVLLKLEGYFNQLVSYSVPEDRRDSSLNELSRIKFLYTFDELRNLDVIMHNFVKKNKEKLKDFFTSSYERSSGSFLEGTQCSPSYNRPEGILLIERLENNSGDLYLEDDLIFRHLRKFWGS